MSAPTLWQLAGEYRALADKLESLDLDEQTIKDTLEGESLALQAKAEACIAVLGSLESQAAAYNQRAAQLAEHGRSLSQRSLWLRNYVRDSMLSAGISEIKGPDFVAKLRTNPEHIIIDAPSQVPWEFWREKTIKEIDKVALKQALKDGDESAAACAHLDRGTSLIIK